MRCKPLPADVQTHTQLYTTPSDALVFQWNCPTTAVFWGKTAGTADTPMGFLCSWGAYEVTRFPNLRVRCRRFPMPQK